MLRRIFTICSALSSLLCVAVLALWVRSYWRYDEWHGNGVDRSYWLISNWGQISYDRLEDAEPFLSESPTSWLSSDAIPAPPFNGFGRASLNTAIRAVDGHQVPVYVWGIWFPHWSAALTLLVLPGIWLDQMRRRLKRKRRLRHGLCPDCGYDLRASSDRCPECGQTISRPGAA